MKKQVQWLIYATAFAGMGIAMPSCPGQQEMKQQIEALQTSNQELNLQIKKMHKELQSLNSDMGQVKQVLPQMTNVIQAQKGALDQLEAKVNSLATKAASKASSKKRR